MPDFVDLSTLKKNDEPSVGDLSEEQQEALAKMAEEINPEPEGTPVRTAFLVVIGTDGNIVAIPDLDFSVVREHMPSADEIYGAVKVIAKDIEVQEGAIAAAGAMQQMAAAQMQARMNQEIAQKLHLPK